MYIHDCIVTYIYMYIHYGMVDLQLISEASLPLEAYTCILYQVANPYNYYVCVLQGCSE